MGMQNVAALVPLVLHRAREGRRNSEEMAAANRMDYDALHVDVMQFQTSVAMLTAISENLAVDLAA